MSSEHTICLCLVLREVGSKTLILIYEQRKEEGIVTAKANCTGKTHTHLRDPCEFATKINLRPVDTHVHE